MKEVVELGNPSSNATSNMHNLWFIVVSHDYVTTLLLHSVIGEIKRKLNVRLSVIRTRGSEVLPDFPPPPPFLVLDAHRMKTRATLKGGPRRQACRKVGIVHIGIILCTLLSARLAGARHILYRLSKLGIVRTVKFKYLLFRKRATFDRNSYGLATPTDWSHRTRILGGATWNLSIDIVNHFSTGPAGSSLRGFVAFPFSTTFDNPLLLPHFLISSSHRFVAAC